MVHLENIDKQGGRNGPDTSEVDAGWDFEPASQAVAAESVDSLRPSYASRPPSNAPFRVAGVQQRRQLLRMGGLLLTTACCVGGLAIVGYGRPKPRVATRPPASPVASATTARGEPSMIRELPSPLPAVSLDVSARPLQARSVRLKVEPPDATVDVRGKRVGGDLALELVEQEGERATVSRPGYRTRIVEIDGSVDCVEIRLERLPRLRRTPKPRSLTNAEAERGGEPRNASNNEESHEQPSEAERVYPAEPSDAPAPGAPRTDDSPSQSAQGQ
ncbi:MAG TPA: hypothetical protein VFQ61_08245 [Polyangiaceae bacterium]|nr:hypothetical protein [Polyangiaceae bacterium]